MADNQEQRNQYYTTRFSEKAIGASDPSITQFTIDNRAAVEFHHLLSNNRAMFKSFITTFNDDHQSEWAEENLYGRMDSTATFKRTSRTITIEFDVPSFSQKEALANFSELSRLKQFLYPGYARPSMGYVSAEYANTFSIAGNSLALSAAPIMRVRFLNYISSNADFDNNGLGPGLLCSIKNISFSPNQEAGEYVVNFEKLYLGSVIIPKLFKINCSLNIYHEHSTGWIKDPKTNKYEFSDNANVRAQYPYFVTDLKFSNELIEAEEQIRNEEQKKARRGSASEASVEKDQAKILGTK